MRSFVKQGVETTIVVKCEEFGETDANYRATALQPGGKPAGGNRRLYSDKDLLALVFFGQQIPSRGLGASCRRGLGVPSEDGSRGLTPDRYG